MKNGPFLFESYVKGWTEIDFLTCDYKLDTDAAVKELLHQLLLRQKQPHLRRKVRRSLWS